MTYNDRDSHLLPPPPLLPSIEVDSSPNVPHYSIDARLVSLLNSKGFPHLNKGKDTRSVQIRGLCSMAPRAFWR